MTNWLSNKWNLIGMYTLCSFCMGYILYNNGLTFIELLVIYLLMSVCTFAVYVLGVSRGMIIYSLQRREIDMMLKKIMKVKEDDDE